MFLMNQEWSLPNRASVGSLSHLLKELDGKLLSPRGHPKEWDRRRGQVCSWSPSIGGKRTVSDHIKETAGENLRFPWWLRW